MEEITIDELYSAVERLMIVEIELKNGEDDPQLIFESLNSTGLDLTDADKVRNFILMNQPSQRQEELYNNYWHKVEKNTDYEVTKFIRDYLTMNENKIPNKSAIYVSFKRYIENKNLDIEKCLKDMLKFFAYYRGIINNSLGIKKADKVLSNINKLEVTVSYPFLLEVIDDFHNELITEEDLIEVLKTIESYVMRRIICKAPTNALNKVFMNLCKEIKKIPSYKDNYVDILKYVLLNKKSSQRFPNEEEFNPSWKNALGDNFNEIHTKYLGTIGNLTLTGYNSKMSNRSFVEKRDMEKGFKESRLRLNKYLSEIDEWNEDTIKVRAEELFSVAAKIWNYPVVDYSFEDENSNTFSLEDNDDFTNTSVERFSFLGESMKVTSWTELYENVCRSLYELDPLPLVRLTKKRLNDECMNKRFANTEEGLRTAFKVGDDVYLEKNLSTEAKLHTLRVIFSEYGIEYRDLSFNIK